MSRIVSYTWVSSVCKICGKLGQISLQINMLCWSEEALALNDDPDTSPFERIPPDHFNRIISMWKLIELLALRLRELRFW